MRLQQLMAKLIRAARAEQVSDAVPYAFEQRVMAGIRRLQPQDPWAIWSSALWRAAVACLALSLLSGAWTVWEGRKQSQTEFAQEFEQAMVLGADTQFDETW